MSAVAAGCKTLPCNRINFLRGVYSIEHLLKSVLLSLRCPSNVGTFTLRPRPAIHAAKDSPPEGPESRRSGRSSTPSGRRGNLRPSTIRDCRPARKVIERQLVKESKGRYRP